MPAGTVLGGSMPGDRGRVATLGIEATTNQAICCIRLGESIDSPYFVTLLRLGSTLLLRRVGGAQPNLSQDLIRSLSLPIPPLPLQQEFARRIAAVERMKSAHRAHLAELDALFASLQHRAFRGEL
nr:restriction endonuclease subunit S [Deltaproteobacteria bacterium]